MSVFSFYRHLSLSLSMWTCFSISVFAWGQARSKLGKLIRQFCIMFSYCYLWCFIHNNAFWSNSNAFSLIICKVHTKRENSGSWKSGPGKAMPGHLFCTTPNKLKLHGVFSSNKWRILEQITTKGGCQVFTRHQGAPGPQARPGG